MGTGRIEDLELYFYDEDPWQLYGDCSGFYPFDDSDVGKVVTFTFSDGTIIKSEPIYENRYGDIIVKFNAEDDGYNGIPTAFPALFIWNDNIHYYPANTPDSVFVNSEFYVPQEKFLNNDGLEHLWSKIKSLVSLKVDKSTGLEYRGVANDANDATSNGIYHFNGSTPNAPTTSPCECFVMAFGERYIQIVARDSSTSDSYLYKRTYYSGTWGSWYRYTGTKL